MSMCTYVRMMPPNVRHGTVIFWFSVVMLFLLQLDYKSITIITLQDLPVFWRNQIVS
jgi:hypothetical protein